MGGGSGVMMGGCSYGLDVPLMEERNGSGKQEFRSSYYLG